MKKSDLHKEITAASQIVLSMHKRLCALESRFDEHRASYLDNLTSINRQVLDVIDGQDKQLGLVTAIEERVCDLERTTKHQASCINRLVDESVDRTLDAMDEWGLIDAPADDQVERDVVAPANKPEDGVQSTVLPTTANVFASIPTTEDERRAYDAGYENGKQQAMTNVKMALIDQAVHVCSALNFSAYGRDTRYRQIAECAVVIGAVETVQEFGDCVLMHLHNYPEHMREATQHILTE